MWQAPPPVCACAPLESQQKRERTGPAWANNVEGVSGVDREWKSQGRNMMQISTSTRADVCVVPAKVKAAEIDLPDTQAIPVISALEVGAGAQHSSFLQYTERRLDLHTYQKICDLSITRSGIIIVI